MTPPTPTLHARSVKTTMQSVVWHCIFSSFNALLYYFFYKSCRIFQRNQY